MIGAMLTLALGAAQTGSAQAGFDRSTVVRLLEAYEELEPVRPPELGGGPPLELGAVWDSVDVHPKMLAAEAKVRAADGERLAAEGGFDTKLGVIGEVVPTGYYDVNAVEAKLAQPTPFWGTEVFGGYRIGRATNLPTYDARETLDRGELKAGIRIPVLADGWIDARRADLRTTALRITAAQASRSLTRLELQLTAAEKYWKWVAAGEGLRVALRLVRLAEMRAEQIDEQVREGAAPPIYQAENLRSLLKRRDILVKAERKLEQAAIALSMYYRGEDGRPLLPAPTRMPPPIPRADRPASSLPDEAVERALERRPELSVLSAMRDEARVEGELADNQILPRLDLRLNVSKDLGTDTDPDTLKSLDPLLVKAGLTLEFPVLLRKGRGKAAKSWAKVAEAEAKLQLARDRVVTQIQDVWSLLVASARRAAIARQAAEVAEAVAAGERVRLLEGATSPFDLNLREQAAADAALEEIDARANLQVALTAWRLVTMADPGAGE